MSIRDLIAELEAQGVEFWIEGESLRFRAPKGVLTEDKRAYLKDYRDSVLELVRERANQTYTFPLSASQQRIWLVEQMNPGHIGLHIPIESHLHGELNLPAFESTLRRIMQRQSVLRTAFSTVDGVPVQIVHESLPFSMEVIDLRQHSNAQQEIERLTTELVTQPFDLSNPPLMRCMMLHHGENEYTFQIVFHHIVMDGWSASIFYREFATIYTALVNNQQPELPQLKWQYSDFALWQQDFLQGDLLQEQLEFWRQQLSDSPALLPLPTDYPRQPVQTNRSMHIESNLSEQLSQTIRQMAQASKATPFMALLAAYALLVGRVTGLDDVPVGSPISGRTRPEVDSLFGIFINNLVLRANLAGNPTFRELLERIRQTALSAYKYQEVPFERLIEELHPRRIPGYTPLFQVFFNMLNFSTTSAVLPGLAVEGKPLRDTGSNFDITLYGLEIDRQYRFTLVYNPDLFETDHMAHFLQQYIGLLDQITADPDRHINDYSLRLDDTALPDMTAALDATWSESFLDHFTANVANAPDRVALSDPNGTWTYGELRARANQLAHSLYGAGIGRGNVVAIYGSRSAELVWAVLGIMKAGAAFLILDPDYPPARLRRYVELAQPAGVIELPGTPLPDALQSALDALNPAFRCQLTAPLLVNESANTCDGQATSDPPLQVGPDDLAYIAFTSGTTGTPKGIAGTLRPLDHFVAWHTRTFDLSAQDRFTMLSGLAHDPLLRDILTPLWLGAALHIPDPSIILSPDRLAGWLQANQITVTHLTPALSQIITSAPDVHLPHLRYAFFGGDALRQRNVRNWRELAPECQCVNFYGTTETPQVMGYYVVPESLTKDGETNEILPIGQSIDDVQLLILTAQGELAGMSEVGEIYIRTPYLTRGYVGDEVLTADRYRTNPTTGQAHDRLYRTGDLGRYRMDGTVECLGRVDQQIKIRGFRIELGEIEAVLETHASVKQAVVIAREDHQGEKRLIAYVTGVDSTRPSQRVLREYTAERLPGYMVPAAVMALDAFPLTPNGKIDRRALPEPEADSRSRRVVAEARTPSEALLVGVWRRVLGSDRISVLDNFFDLGGHSLQVIQVITEIENKTGVRLEPASMRYQTLRQQAATIEVAGTAQAHQTPTDLTSSSLIQGSVRLEIPFYFGPDSTLFGMYYPTAEDTTAPLGVVMCSPWGQEYIRSHRANHQLALRLAGAGLPVLRFDYYGTGDSLGEDHQFGIQRSLAGISAAIEELQQRGGVQRVVLVGMRLGATLAALAGPQHTAVGGVVLWEPLVNGSAYLSELHDWHRRNMYYFLGKIKPAGNGAVTEILGFALSPQVVDEMQLINLLADSHQPAGRILVVERVERDTTQQLCQHLENAGARVTYRCIDAPQMWTENPDKALVPHQTLETIIDWVLED